MDDVIESVGFSLNFHDDEQIVSAFESPGKYDVRLLYAKEEERKHSRFCLAFSENFEYTLKKFVIIESCIKFDVAASHGFFSQLAASKFFSICKEKVCDLLYKMRK